MRQRRDLEMDLRQALVNVTNSSCIISLWSLSITNEDYRLRSAGAVEASGARHDFPGDFIPVAEETGLIIQLGDWVLRKACEETAAWPESLKIAVNLSPSSKARNLVQGDRRRPCRLRHVRLPACSLKSPSWS